MADDREGGEAVIHLVYTRGRFGVSCIAAFAALEDAEKYAGQRNEGSGLRCWVVTEEQ